MNPTKTKYARERAAEIRDGLIANINVRVGDGLPKYLGEVISEKQARKLYADALNKVLTPKVKKALVDKVKIGTSHEYDSNIHQWTDFGKITFPDFGDEIKELVLNCPEAVKVMADRKADREEADRKIEEIKAEHNRVMDLVVLGDEAAALEALSNFAQFCV